QPFQTSSGSARCRCHNGLPGRLLLACRVAQNRGGQAGEYVSRNRRFRLSLSFYLLSIREKRRLGELAAYAHGRKDAALCYGVGVHHLYAEHTVYSYTTRGPCFSPKHLGGAFLLVADNQIR